MYRRTYAEILYAWGELNRRAEILKFVEEPYTAERGLGTFSRAFFSLLTFVHNVDYNV
jgi:hypothetical protein